MRWSTLAAVVVVALGCGSTAPHTIASAGINSALAVGAAAAQRSSGGCYAQCTAGTACNPASGYCERVPDVCVAGAPGCSRRDPGVPLSTDQVVTPPRVDALPGIGVSPATGTVPTLPPERPSPATR